MELLICLAILWFLWLFSSKSWRRLIQTLAMVIITILVVTSPAFLSLLTWGLTAKLPLDSGERVDAIVILGRGSSLRPDRTAAALQLWQAKRASHIFVSGMMDAIPIVEDLQGDGIPISALAGEECSQSTEENALFSAALLHSQGVQDILLVTDSLHMQRSLLVFGSFGFKATPYPIAINSETLPKTQWLSALVREYLGIVIYTLTGKFQKRSAGVLNTPSPEVLQKISRWNCKIPRTDLPP